MYRPYKFVVLGLLAIASSAQAVTIQEMANERREAEYQELRAKTAEAKRKADPPPAPRPVTVRPINEPVKAPGAEPERGSSAQSQEMFLLGVYGIGDNLIAEVSVNGASVPVSKTNRKAVSGWDAEVIEPTRVVLSNGKQKKTLYLEATTSGMTTSNVPNRGGYPVVPPIPASIPGGLR